MRLKSKVVAFAVTATMVVSVAPMTVFAATVKAPAKVTISSVTRTSDTKVKVTWKKLKKTPSGYAVYQKRGSSAWKLTKRVSKKTTSLSVSAKNTEQNQFKVRAYKTYKVKKYYNKKTKKYVSKKAYNKLAKKNRAIKNVTAYKYGKYSAIKTVKQTAAAMPTPEITIGDEYDNGFYKSDYDRCGVYIHVKAPIKVSGVSNLEYLVEKSEDGGKTFKTFTIPDRTGKTDETDLITLLNEGEIGATGFYDYDIDLSVDTVYKVYAKGTFNGKTVTGKASTVTVNAELFNSTERSYNKVIKEGKMCSDCSYNAVYGVECDYDVTNLSDEELAEKHGTTYYCSKHDSIYSHNKADIENHIKEKKENVESTKYTTDHSDATVVQREADIIEQTGFDVTEEITRKMSWVEVDKSDELFQQVLKHHNDWYREEKYDEDTGSVIDTYSFSYSDAEKIFVDMNYVNTVGYRNNLWYIIYHGSSN